MKDLKPWVSLMIPNPWCMNKNRLSQIIFLKPAAMVKPKACRSLLVFLIHAALTLPITHAQIIIDPDTIVFAPRQIHTTSEEKSFTIINTGQENLHISPDDIRLLADGPQSTGLSVLTYNLWVDSDNWPARFVHMLREIRELDPDISGYDHIVIYARASEPLTNARLQLLDTSGVQGNDVTPRIYPNPAHDTINIITDPGSTVSIIDLTGRIIKTFQTTHNHHQLGISGLSLEVYLMQIVGPKSSKIEKFFVN